MKALITGLLVCMLTLFSSSALALPPSNPHHPLHQMKPEQVVPMQVLCYNASDFYTKILTKDKYKMIFFEPLSNKKGENLGIRSLFRNAEGTILMVLLSEKKQTACLSPFSTMDKSIDSGPVY